MPRGSFLDAACAAATLYVVGYLIGLSVRPEGVRVVRIATGERVTATIEFAGVDGDGDRVWRITDVLLQHGDLIEVDRMPDGTAIAYRFADGS